MEIKKVRLVNSNMSVAIHYADESGQENLLILGAENVVRNWHAVEQSVERTLKSAPVTQTIGRLRPGGRMSLYEDLKVKPCNILGFLHFEVCNGNIALGAFAYEKDALLFKDAVQRSVEPTLKKCPRCGADLGDCFVWCPEHSY